MTESWADLFDRSRAYDVDLEAVRETYAKQEEERADE